jgi:hypothetical protein
MVARRRDVVGQLPPTVAAEQPQGTAIITRICP